MQPGSLARCSFRLRNRAGRPLSPPTDSLALLSGFKDSDNYMEKFKLDLSTAVVDLCHQSDARTASVVSQESEMKSQIIF